MRLPAPLPRPADPAFRLWADLLESDGQVRSVDASTTATSLDEVVTVDATAGAVTLTLPPAAANLGKRLTLVKTDASANSASFAASGSDSLHGTAGTTTQWAAITARAVTATDWILTASV